MMSGQYYHWSFAHAVVSSQSLCTFGEESWGEAGEGGQQQPASDQLAFPACFTGSRQLNRVAVVVCSW